VKNESSVFCQICGQLFDKGLITASHLKKHGITTTEYKRQFGKDSLMSESAKKRMSRPGEKNGMFGKNHPEAVKSSISEKKKGKPSTRKNTKVTNEQSLANIRNGVECRSKKLANGEYCRPRRTFTDEERKHQSEMQKKYASENKEEMLRRAKKAVATKKTREYTRSTKGVKRTPEELTTLAKFRELANKRKSLLSVVQLLDRLEKIGLELLFPGTKTRVTFESLGVNFDYTSNDISLFNEYTMPSLFVGDNHAVTVVCKTCETIFNRTVQVFHPNKIRDNICPCCFPREKILRSSGEIELATYIENLLQIEVKTSYRSDYQSNEIDIYIPSLLKGVEYSGIYWHSFALLTQVGQLPTKDFIKQESFRSIGISVMSVYDVELTHHERSAKNMLKLFFRNNINDNNSNTNLKVVSIKDNILVELMSNNSLWYEDKVTVATSTYGVFNDNFLVGGFAVEVSSNDAIDLKVIVQDANQCNMYSFEAFVLSWIIDNLDPAAIIYKTETRLENRSAILDGGFSFYKQHEPRLWAIQNNSQRLLCNEDDDITGHLVYDCGLSEYRWTKQ